MVKQFEPVNRSQFTVFIMTFKQRLSKNRQSVLNMDDMGIFPGQKIIVQTPIGIGNFLMVLPTLEGLYQALGGNGMAILALKPGIRKLAQDCGLFSDIYYWCPDSEPVWIGLKVLHKIRKTHFDVVISLFPTSNWKFTLFSILMSTKKRIGFTYPNTVLPKLVQHISIVSKPHLHDVDQNLRLIEAMNMNVAISKHMSFPEIAISNSEIFKRPFFICHPGSSMERGMDKKRFPADRFAALIQKIFVTFGVRCYLTGDSSEKKLRDEIRSRLADGIILDFKTRTINEVAGIAQRSLFYLGNDSGIMHIAVSVGKPCIALFGPTSEKRTGPYGENHLVIRDATLSCAPCWSYETLGSNPPCIFGDYRCTQNFDPVSEWKQIHKFIEKQVSIQGIM